MLLRICTDGDLFWQTVQYGKYVKQKIKAYTSEALTQLTF